MRARRLAFALALVGPPAAAQTDATCAASPASAACAARAEEDAWERLSRELGDLSADAVLKGGADPRREVSTASAEAARESAGRARAAVAPAPLGPAPGPAAPHEVQRLRRLERYRETLALLQARGLSWGEACPLAALHAFRTDWVAESRRCVTQRIGARTFQAFVGALTRHGAPAGEACVAAERYWNGLGLAEAEEACRARAAP